MHFPKIENPMFRKHKAEMEEYSARRKQSARMMCKDILERKHLFVPYVSQFKDYQDQKQ